MNNLEKLIKFAREQKPADFKATLNNEVSSRIATTMGVMKQSLAKTMFAKETNKG